MGRIGVISGDVGLLSLIDKGPQVIHFVLGVEVAGSRESLG